MARRPVPRRPLVATGVLVAVLLAALAAVGALPLAQPAVAGGASGFSSAGDVTPGRAVVAPQLPDAQGELIAAVGDVACAPTNPVYRAGIGTAAGCREQAVAEVLAGQRLRAFLPLGDAQYQTGALSEFQTVYDQYFGRYKAITRPIPGNHEYMTPSGQGYYSYFGEAAHQHNPFGAGAAGAYSYDIGSWHLIALNSVLCAPITPCTPTSDTMRWLAADLAAHPNRCTLAYWHHPLWSIGAHGDYGPMVPVWNALYDAGVDVVLASHDHNYQRFAPLGRAATDPADVNKPLPPVLDEQKGMPVFIVGTGGANNYSFSALADPTVRSLMVKGSADATNATFGALFMRLGDGGYSWTFSQAAGGAVPFTDAGTARCH